MSIGWPRRTPSLTGRVSASAAKGQRNAGSSSQGIPLRAKDKFDIVTRLLMLGDPEAMKLLAGLEKTEKSDDAKRYAYAARAGIGTAENKARYWNDFVRITKRSARAGSKRRSGRGIRSGIRN